jgi:hypothetical protein
MREAINDQEKIGNLLSGTQPTTSEAMDAKRSTTTLQDFLHKLDQAREWVYNTISEDNDLNEDESKIKNDCSDNISKFKEELPKAEMLAKVVKKLDPTFVKRIHISEKKEYKHVDNIMLFINWLKKIKLKKHFLFETVDLYDSKNIPKVIYCIHGLASFLSKRGFSRGIIVRNGLIFTNEETDLFSTEIKNISMQRFDDISNKLDSEEYDETNNLNSTKTTGNNHVKTIKLAFKSFAWRHAFLSLVLKGQVKVQAIKKFVDFSNEKTNKIINEQEKEIIQKFKNNYEKEVEKDEVLRTIRLLLENQNDLRQIVIDSYPLANDFKNFKKALYLLMHDYNLFKNILLDGFELPLRVIFPDTLLGDYHFSHLLFSCNKHENTNFDISNSTFNENSKCNNDINDLNNDNMMLARSHFFTSKVFKILTEAFKTNQNFDLNPISIYSSIYLHSSVLVEEALNDENVRKEILKRSEDIMSYISKQFQYLLSIDLPYYVRRYSEHPSFFQNFIEPAIVYANNFIISELFLYIFKSENSECVNSISNALSSNIMSSNNINSVVNTNTMSGNNVDFNYYAILKEFLDNSKLQFKEGLISRHKVEMDINDFFINCCSNSFPLKKDILQVKINIEEFNNIIIVLKQSLESEFFISSEMKDCIKSLNLIRYSSPESCRVEMFSNTASSYSPITLSKNQYVPEKVKILEGKEKDCYEFIQFCLNTKRYSDIELYLEELYLEEEFYLQLLLL